MKIKVKTLHIFKTFEFYCEIAFQKNCANLYSHQLYTIFFFFLDIVTNSEYYYPLIFFSNLIGEKKNLIVLICIFNDERNLTFPFYVLLISYNSFVNCLLTFCLFVFLAKLGARAGLEIDFHLDPGLIFF